ncbi:MAG: D-alanyl-D-alanine carboxypeptidase [Clostridia bacterium]|nr:D-alanyl-D-alanine carboxypeptidase [Clostridia bacterium]
MKSKILVFNLIFILLFHPLFAFAVEEPVVNEPEINSEAGFLMELDSGKILFDKNSTDRMFPASTTKILTAILALENCELSEKATVSRNAIALVPSGYTNAKLVAGEEMTVEDLLYGLMLNSANEAANVLAEHISRVY